MAKTYISREKAEELENRLKELKTAGRMEIAERLKKAKEFGDLSENFEYSQAKDDQEKLEKEILEIEAFIKNSQIITRPKNKNVVNVGLFVSLRVKGGKTVRYNIVGSQETDPVNNKISNTSPIGKELMGKKIGDVVKIITPAGRKVEYEILNIE